jgi:hypothetical protein
VPACSRVGGFLASLSLSAKSLLIWILGAKLIMKTTAVFLVALVLAVSGGGRAFAQYGAVSQSERDRLEQKILSSIRYEQSMIELDKKELQGAKNDLDYYTRFGHSNLIPSAKERIAKLIQRIREREAKIEELQAKLANLPPVRDEQAEQERMNAQRESYRRQQEADNARAEQNRQGMEDFFRWQQQQAGRSSGNAGAAALVGGIGSLLTGAAQGWADRKVREAEAEERAYSAPIRGPSRREIEIPGVTVKPPPPKTRVIGTIENRQFIPTPPPPEPARPLFDTPLTDFFSAAAARAGDSLLGEFTQTLKTGDSFSPDPKANARDAAFESYVEVLSTEQQARVRAAYYSATGDKNSALDAAIDLLPPDEQFKVRASQTPLWFLNGSLERTYDKQVSGEAEKLLNELFPVSR